MLNSIKKDIRKFSNPKKARILQRFFKTGIGEIQISILQSHAKGYAEVCC